MRRKRPFAVIAFASTEQALAAEASSRSAVCPDA